MSTINRTPEPFSYLFAQISASQQLTMADRRSLQEAFLEDTLDREELGCVDRILYSVRRGRIEMQ